MHKFIKYTSMAVCVCERDVNDISDGGGDGISILSLWAWVVRVVHVLRL